MKKNALDISRRETLEIEFWKNSPTESPNSNSLDNILNKASEARVFLEKIRKYSYIFSSSVRILELGAGQCWASCMVKREYPNATVVATDIAEAAILSVRKWEKIFDVDVDSVIACRSYETPFDDDSFDLIFAFAAAHHFAKQRRTAFELARVLKPGGIALYLHEPGCRSFIYPLARWRVNAKRPEAPEDVLIYRRISKFARAAGLTADVQFAPTPTGRSLVAGLYYACLRTIALLQHVLPNSIDIVFRKA